MKLRDILLITIASLCLLFSGMSSCGETLTVKSWFDLSSLYGGQAKVSLDGNLRTVYAGQLQATATQSGEQWISYCTDLGATLASGFFTQMPISVAQGLPTWQTPDWSVGGLERAAQVYFTFRDEVDSPQEAVALQVLVWESLYDETPSFTEGRFQLFASGTTSGAYGKASAWLHEDSLAALSGRESWWGPSSVNGDYRVGQGLIGNAYIIPEPSSYVLLLAALPPLLATAWRRRTIKK